MYLATTSAHVVASPKNPASLPFSVLNASRAMFTPRILPRRSFTVLNVLASIPPKIPTIAPTIVLMRSSVNAYLPSTHSTSSVILPVAPDSASSVTSAGILSRSLRITNTSSIALLSTASSLLSASSTFALGISVLYVYSS